MSFLIDRHIYFRAVNVLKIKKSTVTRLTKRRYSIS